MTKEQTEQRLKQVERANDELRKEVTELRLKLDISTSALTTIVNKIK